MKLQHLTKRFFGALSQKPPLVTEIAQVKSILTTLEFDLWSTMPPMDQRHSIVVMQRFVGLHASATKFEIRAALLHDVGKTASNLGVIQRVMATLVGRISKSFSDYHEHEQIGAQMLQKIDSHEITWQLVAGDSKPELQTALQALRQADNI